MKVSTHVTSRRHLQPARLHVVEPSCTQSPWWHMYSPRHGGSVVICLISCLLTTPCVIIFHFLPVFSSFLSNSFQYPFMGETGDNTTTSASFAGSPVEAWVGSGSPWGWGYWRQSFWKMPLLLVLFCWRNFMIPCGCKGRRQIQPGLRSRSVTSPHHLGCTGNLQLQTMSHFLPIKPAWAHFLLPYSEPDSSYSEFGESPIHVSLYRNYPLLVFK